MSIAVLIILVVLGILLILLEIFVVPGVTIAGIGGLALLISGIIVAYSQHGATIGHLVSGGSILFLAVTFYFVFKNSTWTKIALNTAIDSKVNIGIDDNSQNSETTINVGDTGICISRLSPIGKVQIKGAYYEAESPNHYLDPNTEVIVYKVLRNKLYVKPLN